MARQCARCRRQWHARLLDCHAAIAKLRRAIHTAYIATTASAVAKRATAGAAIAALQPAGEPKLLGRRKQLQQGPRHVQLLAWFQCEFACELQQRRELHSTHECAGREFQWTEFREPSILLDRRFWVRPSLFRIFEFF